MKRLIVVLLSLSSCAAGACGWSYSVAGPATIPTPAPSLCPTPAPGTYPSLSPSPAAGLGYARLVETCGVAR